MERKTMMLISGGLLAAILTFVTNWLALIPWRRSEGKHWAERSRLYHPVRVAAAPNLWVIPAVLTLSFFLLWPKESPHWIFMASVTALGAVSGTIPMDREAFPRISLNDLLRQSAVNWVVRFLMWFVFLGAIALMPEDLEIQSLIVPVSVLALCILWNREGWILTGKKLGLVLPPTERLQNIVRATAARMNVSFKDVYRLRSSLAQAYAMPDSRRLLFSERLLQLLSDNEIAAICAHELAHLTETRSIYYKRYVSWLVFLPWIFFKPMVHYLGLMGFFILLWTSVLAPLLARSISHKLELRADHIAHMNDPDEGTYARALAMLYEDNLLPAVNAKKRATHPHLYDRLLSAGLTPDFPRPAPPQATAWHGVLFSAALGMLAMVVMIRQTEHF